MIGFIWLIGKPKLSWNLIKVASFVFIFFLLVSSITGIDLKSSFVGKDPYFQGWVVYAYLGLFSLLVSSVGIALNDVAKALTASAIVVSLVAIQSWIMLNIFNIPIQTYAGRVVSSFGQPNFYAGFLLLTLPLAYLLFKNTSLLSPRSYFGLVGGLLSMIGILVSYSRSTIMMTFLLLALALVDQLKFKLKAGLVIIGIVSISTFLALKFSSGIVGNEFSLPLLVKNPDLTRESVEKRAYIWPEALKIIWQKPLTGFGLENIGGAFSNYFAVNKHLLFEENLNISPVLISLKELNIDRSHNYSLDLLLFSGILGFSVWVCLVGIVFWKLIRKHNGLSRDVLLVALITYLIWIQFQNQSIVHLLYFWLLVGLSNSATR